MIITHKHYHIVYADTVLPLNNKGGNIHVASLSDIHQSDLESCIGAITKANPDVTFNTIQYSENKKKIYFYTDKPILVGAWKAYNTRTYDPVSSVDKLMESIKNIIESEGNLNTGYISAYDLAGIVTRLNSANHDIEYGYKSKLDSEVDYNLGDDASIVVYNFDYDTNQLKVGFKRYRTSKWQDITFSKAHGDLRIVEAESIYAKEVLAACHQTLSDYYDYCMSKREYNKEYEHDVRSLDGTMRVSIGHTGVSIRDNVFLRSQFEIDSLSYSSKYNVQCNSSKVLAAIDGNKNKIFKNVYIKIEDCPSWCKEQALDFRIEQVKEEIKQIRKREFWNKLNPFKKRSRSK